MEVADGGAAEIVVGGGDVIATGGGAFEEVGEGEDASEEEPEIIRVKDNTRTIATAISFLDIVFILLPLLILALIN